MSSPDDLSWEDAVKLFHIERLRDWLELEATYRILPPEEQNAGEAYLLRYAIFSEYRICAELGMKLFAEQLITQFREAYPPQAPTAG